MTLDDKFAALLEGAHKDHLIAYTVAMITPGCWRLAIVRDGETGFYPITEDWFMGSEHAARNEAERLNRMRLRLPYTTVATIVSQSMRGVRKGEPK